VFWKLGFRLEILSPISVFVILSCALSSPRALDVYWSWDMAVVYILLILVLGLVGYVAYVVHKKG